MESPKVDDSLSHQERSSEEAGTALIVIV